MQMIRLPIGRSPVVCKFRIDQPARKRQSWQENVMSSATRPEVGDWYENQDTDELFQVVSLDAASGAVQIQTFDGEVDSIEEEDWEQLRLVAAAAPEDWTGALGDVDPDDVTEDDSASDRAGSVKDAAD
jgi:hypothetical protein